MPPGWAQAMWTVPAGKPSAGPGPATPVVDGQREALTRDPQDRGLGVHRVCAGSSAYDVGGTGNVNQAGDEAPARQRFSCRNRESAPCQLLD